MSCLSRLCALATAAMIFGTPGGSAQAQDEAPTAKLVAAGFAMALPTYWLGVTAHEGSHALMGKLLGAKVTSFSVLPGRYGRKKTFYFGYVTVSGLRTDRQRTLFWLAPKLTDLLLLTGYAGLSLSGNLPDNRYGALALTVLATGFTIDFGKDVISRRRGNDMVKIYNANGAATELTRFPFRVAQAALTVASGYAIYRGYRHVLDDRTEPTVMAQLPLWSGAF